MSERWTCNECGLTHQHRRNLHTLWELDGLDWTWIKHKMEYNPECNCGAMETRHALESGELSRFVTEEAAEKIAGFTAPVPQSIEDDLISS